MADSIKSKVKISSRFFVHSVIPNTKNIDIKFVYNYFVPDESTNESGNSSYLSGGSISGNSYFFDNHGNKVIKTPSGTRSASEISIRSPRQVELTWTQPVTDGDLAPPGKIIPDLSLKEVAAKDLLTFEEDIRSVIDGTIVLFDPMLSNRLQEKANMLLQLDGHDLYDMLSPSLFADLMRNYKYNSEVSDFSSDISKLFDLNLTEDLKRVNELGVPSQEGPFSSAQSALIEVTADRRLLKAMSDSSISRYNFTKNKIENFYKEDGFQRTMLPAEPNPPIIDVTSGQTKTLDILTESPVLPAWIVQSEEEVDPGNFSYFTHVGYVVHRYNKTIKSLDKPSKTFYIDLSVDMTTGGSNIVDSSILYGHTYYYSIRSVYCREFFDFDQTTKKSVKMQQWFASKPTEPIVIKTVETTPPLEPDGVFYKFNYSQGKGLVITWQYPVGKSRDTKYFQIFRRSSIHEPFTCIGELDFNDADTIIARREAVREDKVIKYSGVVTHFEDLDFDRSSDFIYAIASIDAHGLTSGYSNQTRAKFNTGNNLIELTDISKSGAPKQYPNFYVNPDLDETTYVRTFTQDVITSSGKETMKIYLTPDCETYFSSGGSKPDSLRKHLSTTSGEESIYKIQLINVDRQKDDSIEIRINDFRGMAITPQY